MKEQEEKIKKDNVKKILIIILGLSIVALAVFFIKYEIEISWGEIIATIIGFCGVILTIKETEKSRIKQNKFDYQKEKINEEQIEFKKMIKEKVDFLNSVNFCIDFLSITKDNYIEGVKKINDYRAKMMLIKDEIFWYYDKNPGPMHPELSKFMIMLANYIVFYNEKMGDLCDILLKYAQSCDYKKVQDCHIEIVDVLDHYSEEKIPLLYEQAKKVVEERDKMVSQKIIN